MWIHAALLSLSAFLLFLVQPLLAKGILPIFGGSAAVWTTCLVFFPGVLFLGYAYAHFLLTRVPERAQAPLHGALIAASLLLLPLRVSASGVSLYDPIWSLLLLLARTAGLPYFLLSSTGPLVQGWLARDGGMALPYRLYALSNLASLLALLSYPLLIEPKSTTGEQLTGWSMGYAAFALLNLGLTWFHRRSRAVIQVRVWPPLRPLLLWLALSACGSLLLVSISNHLAQNIAPIPLLWVLPLSLYLVTLIISFDHPRWYRRGFMLRLVIVLLGAMSYYVVKLGDAAILQLGIPLFLTGLLFCCFFCHGELAARRPSPEHLTAFYLAIALGGAIGGVSVGVLAPRFFDAPYELSLTFLLTALIAAWITWQDGWLARLLWAAVSVAMAAMLVDQVRSAHESAVTTARNFYGALRVTQTDDPAPLRKLLHGTITHGVQFQGDPQRRQPTAYFSPTSGVGRAIALSRHPGMQVGIIGLGAGTLAAYAEPQERFRFYEINPLVEQIARRDFTYLGDARGAVQVRIGDGRLALAEDRPERYDVFVIDAFSGDAIPVHLLTREAMALYLDRLQPQGIIAFHVSNQYLDLKPIVARLARESGCQAAWVHDEGERSRQTFTSDWILVSRQKLPVGVTVEERADLRTWTDQYSNLLQVLHW